MPFEEKHFKQYFLPYRELGMVKNASKDIIFNIEQGDDGFACLKIQSTSSQEIGISIKSNNSVLLSDSLQITPEKIAEITIDLQGNDINSVEVYILKNGKTVLSWIPQPDEIKKLPPAAEAPLSPEDTKTVEELYLTGLHLEQYRHATYSPLDYYEEGLRRDPGDIRCNNAMGLWYIRKGRFDIAEKYLSKALQRQIKRNPNPYDGEILYNLGVACFYQGKRLRHTTISINRPGMPLGKMQVSYGAPEYLPRQVIMTMPCMNSKDALHATPTTIRDVP